MNKFNNVVKLTGNGSAGCSYQTDLFATGWLIGRGDVWYRRIGDADDGWAAWSFDITVDQDLAWAFFWAAIFKLERKIDVKWPKNVEEIKLKAGFYTMLKISSKNLDQLFK